MGLFKPNTPSSMIKLYLWGLFPLAFVSAFGAFLNFALVCWTLEFSRVWIIFRIAVLIIFYLMFYTFIGGMAYLVSDVGLVKECKCRNARWAALVTGLSYGLLFSAFFIYISFLIFSNTYPYYTQHMFTKITVAIVIIEFVGICSITSLKSEKM